MSDGSGVTQDRQSRSRCVTSISCRLGTPANVNMGDYIEVIAQVPRDVAVENLRMIPIETIEDLISTVSTGRVLRTAALVCLSAGWCGSPSIARFRAKEEWRSGF
jgi:hypothetical protein